jgi:uncharacterized membrane protein
MALRFLVVFALCVSGALFANDLFSGAFCGFASECATVTSSAYSRVLGAPLSAIGLGGFAVLFALALFPERRCSALLRPLALAAGLIGAALIVVQFLVIGHTCTLCLLVNGASVLIAGVAWGGELRSESLSWLRRSAWLAGATLAVAAPFLAAWLNSAFPAPDKIMSYWVKGKITVVEVTDFDCMRCRDAERVLKGFLKDQDAQVRFVRLVAPMPKLVHAWPAATAYLAARAQGKEEEMANALFQAPSRYPDGCRQVAKSLGLNLEQYDKDINDPALHAELRENLAWAKAHAPGLPAIWVQDQRFVGVPSAASLQEAMERAKSFTATASN